MPPTTVNTNTKSVRFVPSENVRCGTSVDGKAPTTLIAFTLIELLVVVTIMVVMLALLVPAFNGIKGGQDITSAAYTITGLLDQARAYAMSNNTFVYVGFAETDASASSSAVPQLTTSPSPYGRVAIAVVATKDGTNGYSSGLGGWVSNYSSTTVSNLTPINKLLHLENVHLADLGSTPPAIGGMARPAIANSTTPTYNIGNSNCLSSTPFAWPLSAPLPASSASAASPPTQYAFFKVIQFDSQGVARIQGSSGASILIAPYMEIALLATHGNVVPPTPANQNAGDLVAIQIDALTGATHIYRP